MKFNARVDEIQQVEKTYRSKDENGEPVETKHTGRIAICSSSKGGHTGYKVHLFPQQDFKVGDKVRIVVRYGQLPKLERR
jgi:hypothetical protein